MDKNKKSPLNRSKGEDKIEICLKDINSGVKCQEDSKNILKAVLNPAVLLEVMYSLPAYQVEAIKLINCPYSEAEIYALIHYYRQGIEYSATQSKKAQIAWTLIKPTLKKGES